MKSLPRSRKCEQCERLFLINGANFHEVQNRWKCDPCKGRPDGTEIPKYVGAISGRAAAVLVRVRRNERRSGI